MGLLLFLCPFVKLSVVRRLAIFTHPVLKVGSWQSAVAKKRVAD